MMDAQLSLESTRRLAHNLNSQLVRQHIEHIDFDRFICELDVIQTKFESESIFENVLGHHCFEDELKEALFQRINNLKQQLAHQGISSNQPVELRSKNKSTDECLRSHLKRQILTLNVLDTKLIEITAKVAELKSLHTECTVVRQEKIERSLSELWKELMLLQTVMATVRASDPESSTSRSTNRPTDNQLIVLFSNYIKWKRALRKCMGTVRAILNKFVELKPQEEELFARSYITSDSSSIRKSVLTERLNKRSLENESDLSRQATIPDSDFQITRSQVRKKERKVRRSPGCGKQCVIF